jgi:hypothetical protein
VFEMMADFFGSNSIHFTIGSDEFNGKTTDQNVKVRPVVHRSFTSFSQAMQENGQSRIYLGIHWSFDKTQGISTGIHVANYIFSHLLQPRQTGHANRPASHRPSQAHGPAFSLSAHSHAGTGAVEGNQDTATLIGALVRDQDHHRGGRNPLGATSGGELHSGSASRFTAF